jgi:hypothetical protein
MVNKFLLLPVIFIIFVTTNIFGTPFEKVINKYEAIMPLPEVQYKLPEELIGEFIMLSNMYNHLVTIFPNNKFVTITASGPLITALSYGYIVINNDEWCFFFLINEGYIRDLTEIFLSDSGFSYYTQSSGVLFSIRRENMPVPVHLAKEITIPNKEPRHQYFIFNASQNISFDLNQIEFSPYDVWDYHLQIDNGIVTISLVGSSAGGGPITFDGFLEITEEDNDAMRGIIKFTNGIPYFYIHNGTADIEINNNGSIIITMLYTPDPRVSKTNQIILSNKLQFPAKLVLEY